MMPPGSRPASSSAEKHRLLNFAELDANTPDRERQFADVRAAWNAQGLLFNVRVTGKEQPVWCRDGRLEDSDGLQVWIDTRATLNIHRASRYCHRYAFLPAGGGSGNTEPVADQLLINRARENARPIRPASCRSPRSSSKTATGSPHSCRASRLAVTTRCNTARSALRTPSTIVN